MLLHEERDGVGKHHDKRQSRRQKTHGVAEGQGEHAVRGHVLVVVGAYEVEGVAAASGEGILHHKDEGDSVEQYAPYHQGGYQQVTLQG